MPLNIVNSTNYINQSGINLSSQAGQSAQATGVSYDSTGSTVTINAKDLGLQTGQTFSGQVVSIDGNDIKLLLDNNQTINAKLDGNVNPTLGQVISFEVKSTEGGQTALRPLYTNLTNSLAVSNALQSAGLPETPSYMKMVSSMMEEGMSINKNALWDMSKEIASFPNADPKTIVQMNRLSLPINELNITQFENYKGFEHQIKNDVINLAKGLTDLMDQAIKDANPELVISKGDIINQPQKAGNNLLNAFFSAITGRHADSSLIQNSSNQNQIIDNSSNQGINLMDDQVSESGDKSATDDNQQTAVTNGEILSENITDKAKAVDLSGFKLAVNIMDLVDVKADDLNDTVNESLNKLINGLIDTISKENIEMPSAEENNQTEQEKTSSDFKSAEVETFSPKSHVTEMTKGEAIDFVKNLTQELINNEEMVPKSRKELLAKLLTNDGFKDILNDSITKQMLLKPEEGITKEKIDDLYAKILKQTNAAVEIANNSGKDASELMKFAQNINNSVDFMNQLNQAVTYVQIPLMMNNRSAHGDLYVYTNKKSLKEKDGNISALLHLDMENLGPMDVYVALKNGTNVKTNFILQDEETIDFIETHIGWLNDRLTKKGYDVNTNVSVKEKNKAKTNMVEEFLKESPDETVRTVTKYSFDVRA